MVSKIFYFHRHPYLGKIFNLTCAYFSDGLVQPPTRLHNCCCRHWRAPSELDSFGNCPASHLKRPSFDQSILLAILPSLKLTFSHLKMDGWNTSFVLGWPIFRGYVSSGSVIPKGQGNPSYPPKATPPRNKG